MRHDRVCHDHSGARQSLTLSYLTAGRRYLRFASGLRPFLRDRVSAHGAQAIVRERTERRHLAFLRMVDRTIFGNARSPYLRLLRAAGCEHGDLARLVAQDGVEGALRKLAQAGVYVRFEEFKGRAPAVRGSQTFVFRDVDFDNPLITPHYVITSGGTSGLPSWVRIDLDYLTESAPHWALLFAAHDLSLETIVFWTPVYPGIANRQLRCLKVGGRIVRWFSSGSGRGADRLRSSAVHALIRWIGRVPKAEFVPPDEAWRVGEALAGLLSAGSRPCVVTAPSAAVRTCLAIHARGMSLPGVTFLLGGEPLTSARKRTIERTGARAIATYGFAEAAPVGSPCPRADAPDDVHVAMDGFAVTQRPRLLDDGDAVDALLITGFRPTAPKILLNTEIGDYGVVESRSCGCLFDDCGHFQHVHSIRSFEKLTGEGMTFVGADLYRLLEEVLPQRFGGQVGDYQLVEDQDPSGLPRYTLRVSPAVGTVDEAGVAALFLERLAGTRRHYRLMVDQWAQARALRVAREHPIGTARGKALPFRTLRSR